MKNIDKAKMVNGGFIYFSSLILMAIGTPNASCLEEQIKKYAFNTNGLGTYSFEYETTGGTYRREDGGFITKPEGNFLVVRGEYGYTDPGGRLISVKYLADSNGYHTIFQDDAVRFNDRRII